MEKRLVSLIGAIFCATFLAGSTNMPPQRDCDTVYTLDGRVIIAQIRGYNEKELTYTLCGPKQNAIAYNLPLSDLKEIHWGNHPVYKVWVHRYGKLFPQSGFLLETTDNSILLARHAKANDLSTVREIPVSDIRKIKFSKRGKMGRNVLTGSIIGAGIGAVGGLATDKDNLVFTKGEAALLIGLIMGVAGAMVGVLFSLFKDSVTIKGNADKYRLLRPLLTRYSLTGK